MIIQSFGGGVQSWGYAALAAMGRVPMPDYAVMVDTGRECQSTWDYLTAHRHQLPYELIVVRQQLPDIFYSNGDCLLPAYFKGGKLPVFCSGKWKRDVFRRFLRERGVRQCDVVMGISWDESERMKPTGLKWLTNIFPLIENRITRNDCLYFALAFGGRPPRSRCWMCPNQDRADWLSLPDNELKQAAAIDAQIRSLDLYLSKLRMPLLTAISLLESQTEMEFGGDCDGGFCYV